MMPEHDADLTECRECGTTFDLAMQNYYDALCPSCIPPERTWPRCIECDDKVPPDERTQVTVPGAARDPRTVKLTVHKSCEDAVQTTVSRPL
jgi:hypothetical protein